jgi:hypothetical protein
MVVVLALAALSCAPLAGCAPMAYSRLWADTALPDGKFSTRQRQQAYDGEPVTFELETDPGAVNFVVFGIDGDETVVQSGDVAGRYRWTHIFHAGPEPQDQEVYAQAFLMRGKCDWVYDRTKDAWFFYPGTAERADIPSSKERTMRIICYRMEIRLPVVPRGGPPRRVEMTLTRMAGQRTSIPRNEGHKPDAAGFLLVGPGEKGAYEVVYTPKHTEISRAGRTHVKLVVEHADKSVERILKDFDTP